MLIVSGLAQAQSVGDQVTYVYTDPDQPSTDLLQRKMIISEYSEPNFIIQDFFYKNGALYSQFKLKISQNDLPHKDDLKNYVKNCATSGSGHIAEIDIPAGHFLACEKTNQSGDTAWLAEIPIFGVLKQKGIDGVYELQSYKFGAW